MPEAVRAAMPQRSPGLMAGESAGHVRQGPDPAVAATEPRPDGRGEVPRDSQRRTGPFLPQRSPGLMAGESRASTVGGYEQAFSPQRSPGLMAGERVCLPEVG